MSYIRRAIARPFHWPADPNFLGLDLLSPFAEQGHQASTETHHEERKKDSLDLGSLHRSTEHELVGHQLHKTSVDEDPGRYRVENTVDDECGLRFRWIGFSNA